MSTQGRFLKEARLGEGTYGVVYKARERETDQVFALKRMNIPNEEEGVPATTIREICLLKELRHRNVVHLADVLFQAPKLTLVFEYCPYDLKKYMDAQEGRLLDPATVRSFTYQLLCGIGFIHSRSIVHRDLKPQNLLVTDNLTLKIADFGLARVEGIPVKKYSHEAVTLWYRSPDVILGTANYGLAVDMWSVGCILAEMATGTTLFNGRNDSEQLLKIFRLLGSPRRDEWPSLQQYPNVKSLIIDNPQLSNLSSSLKEFSEDPRVSRLGPHFFDLLCQLLVFEPTRRLTAHDALKHRYVADLAAQENAARAAPPVAAAASATASSSSAPTRPVPPSAERPPTSDGRGGAASAD